MPPVASGIGLPWDVCVADPIAVLATARAELGDTFVVDSGEDRYLFAFSARGVESFYALPEELASKGLADFRRLRRKLPDEIFLGRPNCSGATTSPRIWPPCPARSRSPIASSGMRAAPSCSP